MRPLRSDLAARFADRYARILRHRPQRTGEGKQSTNEVRYGIARREQRSDHPNPVDNQNQRERPHQLDVPGANHTRTRIPASPSEGKQHAQRNAQHGGKKRHQHAHQQPAPMFHPAGAKATPTDTSPSTQMAPMAFCTKRWTSTNLDTAAQGNIRTSRTPGSQPYGYSQQLPWRRPTPPRQAQLLRCAAAWQPGQGRAGGDSKHPCDIPRPPQVFHGESTHHQNAQVVGNDAPFRLQQYHAPSFHTIKKVRGRNTHDSRMSSGVANRFTRHHRTGPWVVISHLPRHKPTIEKIYNTADAPTITR